MGVSDCSLAQGTDQNPIKHFSERHTRYTYHIYMTRPVTFLAWYRHFNEKWRG